jgi:hypothetical protein
MEAAMERFIHQANIDLYQRLIAENGILDRTQTLFGIESEHLELPAPFRRQIAETLDADAAG